MHDTPTPAASHWLRTRRITFALLAVWAALILAVAVFARDLAAREVFGMPLPFYFFSQGALLFFLALVVGHTWFMNRLDRRESTDRPPPRN